jgi:hypothetical protein
MADGSTNIKDYRGWGLREVTYVITIMAAVIAFIAWSITIDKRMFASENQKETTLYKVAVSYEHSQNKDIHQPYQEKLKSWYQRKEGEENRTEIKILSKRVDRLERMEKTLNDIKAILLNRYSYKGDKK